MERAVPPAPSLCRPRPFRPALCRAGAWCAYACARPEVGSFPKDPGAACCRQRDARLAKRIYEANRYSVCASTKEMILERSPWGFNLRDVTRLVHLYHGMHRFPALFAAARPGRSPSSPPPVDARRRQGHACAGRGHGLPRVAAAKHRDAHRARPGPRDCVRALGPHCPRAHPPPDRAQVIRRAVQTYRASRVSRLEKRSGKNQPVQHPAFIQ